MSTPSTPPDPDRDDAAGPDVPGAEAIGQDPDVPTAPTDAGPDPDATSTPTDVRPDPETPTTPADPVGRAPGAPPEAEADTSTHDHGAGGGHGSEPPPWARPHPPAAGADGERDPDAAAGLLRSRRDRVLFGVCGGIAERYGMDAWLVRIVLVGIALFSGGAALLAYLAAALLVPDASASTGGPQPDGVALLGRAVVVAAAVVAALVVLVTIAVASAATAYVGAAWVVGVLVLLLGVALAVFARDRRSRWLLLPLLALALPAAVVSASDVGSGEGVGDRFATPRDASDVPPGGYRLSAGSQTIDLRSLRLGERPTRIRGRVDAGQLVVILPERCVDVRVRARGSRGDDGADDGGPGGRLADGLRRTSTDRWRTTDAPRDAPRLDLDLRAGLGRIAVTRDPVAGRLGAGADTDTRDPCAR